MVDAWITIDLGSAYIIDFLELFNTLNAQYFDRGTGDFRILASNSVTQVGNLNGNISTLIDSTLLAEPRIRNGYHNGPLNAQSFFVTNTSTFRYLQFRADSVAVGGVPCCGSNVYGLNEIRVSAVPEPTSIAIVALGVIGLASRRFKKQS